MSDLILVTGATGFIGAHLVAQLAARGDRVRLLVRSPDRLVRVGLAATDLVEVARGDLVEPASVRAALTGVSRVYHVAGLVSTDRRDRELVHRVNHDATVSLFEEIRRSSSVERTVYLASIFALGGSEGERPVDEEVDWNLADLRVPYVEAKRRAELFALRCRDDGMPLVFVYPCFCYGPGDVNRSSSRLIEMHLAGLLLASLPGGQNAMDVRDAAAGLVLGMDRGRLGERYIVGGVNATYAELGRVLAGVTGRRPPSRLRVPPALLRLAGRVAERALRDPPVDAASALLAERRWFYDDRKARRELGYDSRPLEETFRDAVEWLRAAPQR